MQLNSFSFQHYYGNSQISVILLKAEVAICCQEDIKTLVSS